MDEAKTLYIEVWNRLTLDWSNVLTFHHMGTLGQDSAKQSMYRSTRYFVEESLLKGEYKTILNDPEGFVREGHAKQAPLLMTENAVTTYRQSLDAASLVFVHSILDAASFDCLRVSALSSPKDWMPILREKKIPLEDMESRSFNEVLAETINDELARLER